MGGEAAWCDGVSKLGFGHACDGVIKLGLAVGGEVGRGGRSNVAMLSI